MNPVIESGTGPFTTAQAAAWGLSLGDIRYAVRSGNWARLRHGVFVTASDRATAAMTDPTLHAQDIQALRLAMPRRHLVAAGISAARIHGLDLRHQPSPELIVVTDDHRVASTHRDGYFLRVAKLAAEQVTTRHGVPVTTPARTLIDLAAHCGLDEGVVATESAYRRRLITADQLHSALDEAAGRSGIQVARECAAFADPASESVLESVSRLSMRSLGMAMPLTQVIILDDGRLLIRVDFLWPELRLVGEADGMAKYSFHGRDPLTALREERNREQIIRDLGYDIVRWDWRTACSPNLLAARLAPAFAGAAERLRGKAG